MAIPGPSQPSLSASLFYKSLFLQSGQARGAGFCHLPGEQWLLATLADSLSDQFPSVEELQAGQGDKLKYNFALACRVLEAREAKNKVEVLLLQRLWQSFETLLCKLRS